MIDELQILVYFKMDKYEVFHKLKELTAPEILKIIKNNESKWEFDKMG